VAATARALAACGVRIRLIGSDAAVEGGALRDPAGELDFGNSGTGVRLAAGLLAGSHVRARLTGDASLSTRPMWRVVEPLRRMGADVRAAGEDRFLPLEIGPADLRPLDYSLPVASAQVKSCVLLAGLAAGVAVTVREPVPTRDHTERLLAAMGAEILTVEGAVRLAPAQCVNGLSMRVPGDFSSAAFLLGIAALVPGARVALAEVGVNPQRTGFLEALREMGAEIGVSPRSEEAGEPVADLRAEYAGRLRGIDVPPELVPRLVDEVPLLAVLAAAAEGRTRIRGAGELRLKESDRLRALAEGLQAVGGKVKELEDGLEVTGSAGPFEGLVETRRDHRIAMAFAVLGRLPGSRIRLSETASIATSFPEFPRLLEEAAP
jgi:3-phosphoshikimate 1-carboxyvinyltransferase